MSSKSFFTKSGKTINPLSKGIKIQPAATIYMDIETEKVSSLWESTTKTQENKNRFRKIKSITNNIKGRVSGININTYVTQTIAITLAFFMATAGTIYFTKKPVRIVPSVDQYSVFSAKPLEMDEFHHSVYTKDSRSQRLNGVFKEYNCPMEGLGEMLVQEADKNDIPWWIVGAIAFQESSCGKVTPEIEGQESYNAWGWAVYGDNVHEFDNWARGIETVSKYLSKRFYSQGITNTCEIMETYTPPSNGSWCEGVNHFRDLFVNYKTPDVIGL